MLKCKYLLHENDDGIQILSNKIARIFGCETGAYVASFLRIEPNIDMKLLMLNVDLILIPVAQQNYCQTLSGVICIERHWVYEERHVE